MKNISWAAASLVLSLLLVISIGCDEKGGNDGGGGGPIIASLVIQIDTDTLRFLPGDSASTTITIIASDQNGNVVANKPVAVSLSDPSLGFIEFLDPALRDTTNEQGRINLLFTAIGRAGDNTFTAQAGSVIQTRILGIRELIVLVGTLSISVSPNLMAAAPGNEQVADVTVTIADFEANAIVGISLRLTATGGRLAPLPATDDNGIAQTRWFSNDEFGTFEISVSAGELTRTALVTVDSLENEFGILTVSSDIPRIRADGCVTEALITAVLKDQHGAAVQNDTVRFGAPQLGSIEPFALTDQLGRAELPFCEFNIPNTPGTFDSAIVVARYIPWGLRDTTRIWINEAEDVDFVTITVPSTIGTAGIDSISINLEARFESGAPVDGLWAHFERIPCGSFTFDSMRVINGGLENAVHYRLCEGIPDAADEPWIKATIHGVESNQISFNVQPGSATTVLMDAPLTAFVNVPVDVQAEVVDTFFNHVGDGELVQFTSSIGSINPMIGTTVDGFAHSSFNPGTQAGPAIVRAQVGLAVDSSVIQVAAGTAHAISLTVSSPSLEASGTGGIEWTQLQATVVDANGNPVPDGTWVTFTILNGPGMGENINDEGLSDSSQTANGTAVVTLNAGTRPGAVYVEACTFDEASQMDICVRHGGIAIVAGPPFTIIIYPNELGIEGPAADWDLQVSALVMDAQQNAVRCGTAVFFDLFPVGSAQVLSRNVVTCNEDMNGDTLEGVAYTVLRYLSPQTFNTVGITASTANGIATTIEFVLPLQGGEISLNCAPSRWHFGEMGAQCRIECRATVMDGHHTRVNGALVYFSSTRGSLFDNSNGSGDDVSYAYSAIVDGIWPGTAILWLVSTAQFIFPDPITPEIPGQVSAEVVGYPEATDSQIINFQRGGG